MKALALLTALAAGSAHASPAKHNEIKMPKTIVCKDGDAELKMYTRLGRITSKTQLLGAKGKIDLLRGQAAKDDETAVQDYLSITIDKKVFEYSSWTCDSWDYFFTASTKELMEAADSDVTAKSVVVRVRSEVRGDVMSDADQLCTATY